LIYDGKLPLFCLLFSFSFKKKKKARLEHPYKSESVNGDGEAPDGSYSQNLFVVKKGCCQLGHLLQGSNYSSLMQNLHK
jgi:hypothetical protein